MRAKFLWAGLIATVVSSGYMTCLLLANNLQARTVALGLEGPALAAALTAYTLLLLGVKHKTPLGISMFTVLLFGWAGNPVVELLPQYLNSQLVPLTFMMVPLLALESLRREAPLARNYFWRAQIVSLMATGGLYWLGFWHPLRVISLALGYLAIGYVAAGSLKLMKQTEDTPSAHWRPLAV